MPSAALYPHILALCLPRMLNIQMEEFIHYTRKLGHCNFTRLDLSEIAQLIGGGKKIGNCLTCKRGQKRTMRERKEFSRSSSSLHKINAQKAGMWKFPCGLMCGETTVGYCGKRSWVRGRAESLAEGGWAQGEERQGWKILWGYQEVKTKRKDQTNYFHGLQIDLRESMWLCSFQNKPMKNWDLWKLHMKI